MTIQTFLQLEHCQGLGQSLLDADFVHGFTAGLSNQRWQKQTQLQWRFLSFLLLFSL
jgi:hypothetical protein